MLGGRAVRRCAALLAVALALFVAFEVGVRLITPDAVGYTVESGGPISDPVTRTGIITDPATVARLRAALSSPAQTTSLKDAYLSAWAGDGCSYGSWSATTLRFTWRGLPVEVVSPGPGCAFEWSQLSSGGLPDPQLHLIDFGALGALPR